MYTFKKLFGWKNEVQPRRATFSEEVDNFTVNVQDKIIKERARRNNQLARQVLELLITEVGGYKQESVLIIFNPDRIEYRFMTLEGKEGVGTVDTRMRAPLMELLSHCSEDGLLNLISSDEKTKLPIKVNAVCGLNKIELRWGEALYQHSRKELPSLEEPNLVNEHDFAPKIIAFPVRESTVNIPTAEAARVFKQQKPVQHKKRRATVLIVDDNLTFINVLQRFFARQDIDVVHALNGESALETLRGAKQIPELIVCDVHMDGMSGFDFLKSIRSEQTFEDIPFVMLTSDEDLETELKVLSNGADAFVAKSDDPRILCAHVKRLVGKALKKKAA